MRVRVTDIYAARRSACDGEGTSREALVIAFKAVRRGACDGEGISWEALVTDCI